jgi:hypothetical protein
MILFDSRDEWKRIDRLITHRHNRPLVKNSGALIKQSEPFIVHTAGGNKIDDTKYLATRNEGCLDPNCLLSCSGNPVDGMKKDNNFRDIGQIRQ